MAGPDSGYDGPVRESVFKIGGRPIRLVRPGDPDRLLTDQAVLAWNARDDYMPYWAYLWPGAFLLAEAVAREAWAPGTRALELGCGLGLAGLAGLVHGLSRVDFTDYDEAPLRFVRHSAGANAIGEERYSTSLLDWRSPPDQQYPVILGADILYEKRLVPLVLGVVDRMLSPTGIALVAGPYRVASDDLPTHLQAAGFRHETTPLEATQEDGKRFEGTLHRIWKQ
jgi:predicted nicotinamide N-methyase